MDENINKLLGIEPELDARTKGVGQTSSSDTLSTMSGPGGQMFCRNCGKAVSELAIACPACGVSPRTQKNFCYRCGKATSAAQIMCVQCGSSLEVPQPKDKITAGLVAFFFGAVGAHKFYLGYTGTGFFMLTVFMFGALLAGLSGQVAFLLIPVLMNLIGLVECLIYFTRGKEEFITTYVLNKRTWF